MHKCRDRFLTMCSDLFFHLIQALRQKAKVNFEKFIDTSQQVPKVISPKGEFSFERLYLFPMYFWIEVSSNSSFPLLQENSYENLISQIHFKTSPSRVYSSSSFLFTYTSMYSTCDSNMKTNERSI